MKRAISISLGSSKRDKKVVVNFKGEDVQVEHVDTDDDVAKARQMYLDLDGKVDVFGVGGAEHEPKCVKYFEESDLLAGDFLFMRKYMPTNLSGKTVVTNTTTEENIQLLKERGVKTVITTTPRYDGRSFGTNMLEAVLTAYVGKGRRLTDDESNRLIDELELKPSVIGLL